MPRQPRIEFAGACYHVFNRGNYRQDLFTVGSAGPHFETTLFEACGRYGWRLHAYVLMSNHYHAALETAEPNLTTGMQWLQSTFANRFNRAVRQRGHVFQGRYKSLLIEDRAALLSVVNYIHLNPVRAVLVSVAHIPDYALSSFPKFFWRHARRPPCLTATDWLWEAGGLKPTLAGMRRYQGYLAHREEADPGQRDVLYRRLCRGWYIGTREGRRSLVLDKLATRSSKPASTQRRRYGEDAAEALLHKGLGCLSRTKADLQRDRKGAKWKVILACWIRQQTGISNRWLAEHVHLGAATGVSRLLQNERRRPRQRDLLWRKLAKC